MVKIKKSGRIFRHKKISKNPISLQQDKERHQNGTARGYIGRQSRPIFRTVKPNFQGCFWAQNAEYFGTKVIRVGVGFEPKNFTKLRV